MMPVNHDQSCVCHITVLADAGLLPQNESNRILTAVDLTATGVIVNKQFLKVTYSLFNADLWTGTRFHSYYAWGSGYVRSSVTHREQGLKWRKWTCNGIQFIQITQVKAAPKQQMLEDTFKRREIPSRQRQGQKEFRAYVIFITCYFVKNKITQTLRNNLDAGFFFLMQCKAFQLWSIHIGFILITLMYLKCALCSYVI